MNICVVTPTYPPVLGGTQQFIFNFVNKLTQLGHSVTVITSQVIPTSPLVLDGPNVIRFSSTRKRGLVLLTQNTNCFRQVIAAHKKGKFDLLHQFHVVPLGITCISLRVALHRPLITTLMGWDTFSPEVSTTLFYRFSRPVASLVLNSSDALTSPSQDLTRRAYKDGCQRDIDVIPHAVDPAIYTSPGLVKSAGRLRAKLDIEATDRLVLTVCRLARDKNIETLIHASAKVLQQDRHVKFVIVGDGPEYCHLLNLVHVLDLDERVRFIGRVASTEMPTYYAASDVSVLPSLYESFGLVVLEAMAAGKPVIASNIGAIPEIVDDQMTGFLFPPRDVDRLTDLLFNILGDNDLRNEMGMRGKKKVQEQFSWERVLDRYLAVYERVIA